MSRSSRKTRPAVGVCRPVMTLNSVVLPAPFGPMRPVTRLAAASTSTPASAVTPPNRTSTASTRNTDKVVHLLRLGHIHRRGPLADASRRLGAEQHAPDAGTERSELARPPVGVAGHAENAETRPDVRQVAHALEGLLQLRDQAERQPAQERPRDGADAGDRDEQQEHEALQHLEVARPDLAAVPAVEDASVAGQRGRRL